MSRSHGRVLARIWSDAEFIAQTAEVQRLYLFLLSQPDLNHAGLIPMRVRRWAASVAGQSVEDVQRALKILDAARFALMDEDTEEVLVRTLVRNDGVYKQPKVMIRMRQDAMQMTSPRLRKAFADEMRRLPFDELTGAQRRDAEMVAWSLVREFDPDCHTLPEGYGEGYPEGSGGPSPEGSGIPSACAHAPSPGPHPPAPIPLPPASHLLTLVGRLAGSDARANGAGLPTEVVESWQRIAGAGVDLEAEAAAYFAKQGGRPARDEAAAWVGWLRQANRLAARAQGSKPIGCSACLNGWLPDDLGFASPTPCQACKPHTRSGQAELETI